MNRSARGRVHVGVLRSRKKTRTDERSRLDEGGYHCLSRRGGLHLGRILNVAQPAEWRTRKMMRELSVGEIAAKFSSDCGFCCGTLFHFLRVPRANYLPGVANARRVSGSGGVNGKLGIGWVLTD